MNTSRLLKLIIGAALLAAILVVMQMASHPGVAKVSDRPSTGMGDLRRFEGQVYSRPSIGMGDLRRFEGQVYSRPSIGMGDLRRFEGQVSSTPETGMGELRRFEAQQELENSADTTAPSP
jgi:hypothetical protein